MKPEYKIAKWIKDSINIFSVKSYIICAFVLLVVFNVKGQDNLKVSIDGGYGTYQFDELKQFQTDLLKFYPDLPVKAVEQFPGFINYSASIEYRVYKNLWLGLNGGYFTTGGRNHIEDYSGEYRLDIPASGKRLGGQLSYMFPTDKKIKPFVRLKGGVLFSTVKTEEYFVVHDVDSTSTNYKFKGTSFWGEPSVGLAYEPVKKLFVYLNAGYQFDWKGELYKNGDEPLLFQSGDHVRVNWSGLKLSLGVSFSIF
ncbi:MAG: hypothetical protein GX126_11415 [Bacteroidales bacterium]|nr:hypothetical protein [Bacteroidales bacterium]